MTKIIAVTNQKGGVGKTTTSVNLAASLAAAKRKVLLIDLDPQGNAAMGCGIDKANVAYSSCDLLIEDVPFSEMIIQVPEVGFDVIAGNADLTLAEVELMKMTQRERRLAAALQQVEGEYDYILIDCPPSLGLLTLNALTCSNSVIIPIQCEYYALEGLGQLLNTVRLVQKNLNPNLEIEGVLLTMYDSRLNLSKQVAEEVRSFFKDKIFQTIIQRNVRLSEAPSFGKPALLYDANSTGAQNYMTLVEEILSDGN